MSGMKMVGWTLGFIAAAAFASGCGSALKEGAASAPPGGDPQQVELATFGCSCHPDALPILAQWNASRHANSNQQPEWGAGYFPQVTCAPCHTGEDHAGDALPVPRLVVDCRQCHQFDAGVGHGTMKDGTQFLTCTGCHAPTAGAARTDHHGADSPYSWIGADETPLGDYGAFAAMSGTGQAAVFYTSHITLAGQNFPQFIVSPAWAAENDGPWHYVGAETINDTHFTESWITNEDNKLTKFTSATAQLGYVDLTDTSYNPGMARKDAANSCTASCHQPHVFDLAINRQWGNGGHHPVAEGPLFVNSSGAVKPSPADGGGPANWDAVDDAFTVDCGRCHTANGFAEQSETGFPRFGIDGAGNVTANGAGQYLTCNACHDGLGYPGPEATRLRFTQAIPLYNYAGRTTSIYTIRDAGKSAVCMYCHQAREDGTRIDANIKAYAAATGSANAQYTTTNKRRSKALRFRNSHYLASAAVLYGKKGYEFSWATTNAGAGGYGTAYAGSFFPHIDPAGMGDAGPCATCHMDDSRGSATLGGHTFFNRNDAGEENTAACNGAPCHVPRLAGFGMPAPGDTSSGWAAGDWTGDGSTLTAEGEMDALMTTVLGALLRYQGNQGAVILSSHTEAYPYFVVHYHNAYDTTLAKAAFNWQFLYKATGSWAHNWRYSVELLRDTWRSLTGSNGALGPVPPGDDPRGPVAESSAF
jgi:hypothetical protein